MQTWKAMCQDVVLQECFQKPNLSNLRIKPGPCHIPLDTQTHCHIPQDTQRHWHIPLDTETHINTQSQTVEDMSGAEGHLKCKARMGV